MRYEHDPHYPLPLHDPAAVDFRAFYPYTPNEVKHRRRTTSAQLKVLEAVFRVDTKPNATLRNDLAAQLGMTARGVQVWFQNRRAKEKNKSNKKQNGASVNAGAADSASGTDLATTGRDASPKDEDETDPASPPPATPNEDLLEGLLKPEGPQDIPPNQHADPQTNPASPTLGSPPKLHLLTDPAIRPSSASSWKPTPSDESPPDSAVFPSRHTLADMLSQRRGSLPANAFFHPFATTSTHGPRSIDAWDPLARRRSVDTSLQRLVMHPYAHHARARNGALFGPQSPSLPQSGRQSSLSGKKSISLQARKPFLPHRGPPSNYLDMRRASMDPRTLMPSRTDGLSPSPSPRPLHAVRASLPDTSLFTSSRRYVAQIPGPLPEPNFTFGAATTSSPTDDEPPSPNLSSYSFPPRGDVTEDDDVMSSFSFDTLSRFGSTVSVATSESSVFSNSAFYDIGELAPNQNRRSSCGSAVLSCVAANPEGTMPPLQSPTPVTTDGYFDETATCTLLTTGVNLNSQPQVDDVSPPSSFTSPASTASPDGGSATQSSTPPAAGSVSTNNELTSAFSSRPPELTDHDSSSLSDLNLTEQQQQPRSGSSSSHVLTPPPNQQPGHQTRAIENESFGFDSCSGTRIDITPTALEGNPNITGSVLTRHDVDANQQPKDSLNDEATQIRGDFTAQYSHLMDEFDFGAALAMFDSGPTAPPVGGQAEQRSRGAGECSSLVNLGLGAGATNFATSGVVAPGVYGAAVGIVPDQPTFAS